ncbi:MAG: ABC transporter permease [Deltaproteobacteria bacterium]|nr:ABC transporter permease [Deltaproteobacteria bacterium]MBW2153954.1 ABC transporter permease [Deltaproteobacteria bacterium]
MQETLEQQDFPAQLGEEPEKPDIWWVETARMFYANKAAVLGLAGLMIITFVGLFGPVLFRADPFEIVAPPLTKPGGVTCLGTDYLGRDVFIGLIYGARPTLAIAVTATAFTVFIGMSIGAVAGFYGGQMDNLLMRITEFFQVLPPLVLAMVIVGVFTPNFLTVIFAIAVVSWTGLARLTRAEFLKLKEREFVMAARAVGARNNRLIIRVILPNALPPLIIAVTLRIGITIIYEAALSFLGLTDPDIMTWGKMIGLSRDFFFEAWWTVTFPGLAILITALCIALIGDGLNDAFNPKLRGR